MLAQFVADNPANNYQLKRSIPFLYRGVGRGKGVGRGPGVATQYLPPVFIPFEKSVVPPQTIIWLPVQTEKRVV